MGEPIPARLADAKVGDLIWYFDVNKSRYVDGKYAGRGDWGTDVITGETSQSFIVGRQKFDRKTGHERGAYTHLHLYGEQDRYDRIWVEYAYRVGTVVQRCRDANKIREIAKLVGWPTPSALIEEKEG